jgi:signal transduction histidine kinase/CheY-like chemotaxis protein
MQPSNKSLLRKLEREQKARKEAEELLDSKSRALYRLNQKLQEANHNLEAIVAKRTSELESALKEAKLASYAKGQFLANMSHEIRTPLNGIIGFLDLMESTSLTETQQNYIDRIGFSGKLLLGIIEDILEFSRIEEGKLDITNAPLNIEDCIYEVMSGLSNDIGKRGLDTTLFVHEDLSFPILSDEGRIRQILVNLIGNAMKFTPSGFVNLRAMPIYKDSGDFLSIRVIDSGVGIPKNKIQSVFENFTQVDITDKRKYGGTGLGLSICKSIAEAMGGELRCRSLEGQGSIFELYIPLKFADKPDTRATPTIDQNINNAFLYFKNQKLSLNTKKRLSSWGLKCIQDDKTGLYFKLPKVKNAIFVIDQSIAEDEEIKNLILKNPHQKIVIFSMPHKVKEFENMIHKNVKVLAKPIARKTLLNELQVKTKEVHLVDNEKNLEKQNINILVAEDNEINQQLMEVLLDEYGFNFKIVDDGAQAIEAYNSKAFDLILMDCQMPEKDGFEATLEIREKEKQDESHIPIVAMTANAFRQTKERCFEVGMDSFLTKPIKPADLFKELQSIISEHIK